MHSYKVQEKIKIEIKNNDKKEFLAYSAECKA